MFFGMHCPGFELQLGARQQKSPLAPPTQLVSLVQLVGQVLAPLHTYGEQLGMPCPPGGTVWQLPMPGGVVRSQRWHAPALHALPQHTPSTQKLETH
jgi:hypothetical protein